MSEPGTPYVFTEAVIERGPGWFAFAKEDGRVFELHVGPDGDPQQAVESLISEAVQRFWTVVYLCQDHSDREVWLLRRNRPHLVTVR